MMTADTWMLSPMADRLACFARSEGDVLNNVDKPITTTA